MGKGRRDMDIMKPAITSHLVRVLYPGLWCPSLSTYVPLDASIPVRDNGRGSGLKVQGVPWNA